jgi:hypothetical protein
VLKIAMLRARRSMRVTISTSTLAEEVEHYSQHFPPRRGWLLGSDDSHPVDFNAAL